MRFAHAVLLGAACHIASATGAIAQSVSVDSFVPPRSLAEIESRFRRGRLPSPKALVGRWTMQSEIFREDGDTVPQVMERIFGARRADLPGNPLEWTLEIRHVRGAAYEVTSHNPWEPTNDTSPVRFRRSEITFDKLDGSDMAARFRCRALGTRRLVCLNDHGRVWNALEFTKDK